MRVCEPGWQGRASLVWGQSGPEGGKGEGLMVWAASFAGGRQGDGKQRG